MSASNETFIRRAIELARNGMNSGMGGPFGAVVVHEGRIVAEGCNEVLSSKDPTAHAEVVAIRRASIELASFDLAGCEIYASCEPCPMCLGAILWARIDRIVYAATREDAARAGFDDAAFYQEIVRANSERTVPSHHHPSPSAKALFDSWLGKEDRDVY